MSVDHPLLSRNPRVYAVLNALIGVLLAALAVVNDPMPSLGIGGVAMVLGGAILVAIGLLGVWRPVRWGVAVEHDLIGWVYALAVVLLVAALVVNVV